MTISQKYIQLTSNCHFPFKNVFETYFNNIKLQFCEHCYENLFITTSTEKKSELAPILVPWLWWEWYVMKNFCHMKFNKLNSNQWLLRWPCHNLKAIINWKPFSFYIKFSEKTLRWAKNESPIVFCQLIINICDDNAKLMNHQQLRYNASSLSPLR